MERHARFILGAWERAFEDTVLSERHQRRLVVAGVPSLWDIFLQDWLTSIYRAYPTLGIRAEESTPLRVVEKLEQSMIDVGFLYETPRIREVGVEEVMTIPLLMVSSRSSITASRRSVMAIFGWNGVLTSPAFMNPFSSTCCLHEAE